MAKKLKKPFHALFTAPALARVNVDYRLSAQSSVRATILQAAVADYTQRGMTLAQYLGYKQGEGGGATGGEILDWYANGATLPADRPGLVAMFHPQFHHRGWDGIAATITAMAKALERWMWIVEAEGSRWYLVMVGDDPDAKRDLSGASPAWARHVRVQDQYIAVVSPKGVWKMLGCS